MGLQSWTSSRYSTTPMMCRNPGARSIVPENSLVKLSTIQGDPSVAQRERRAYDIATL